MRIPRVLASLASLALMAAVLAPAALAGGGPVRFVNDLTDPGWAADEADFVAAYCGLEDGVDVTLSGHIVVRIFPDDRRSIGSLDVYNWRGTYVNRATGETITVTDAGPDRFYTRNGVQYVAVTGRSTTGTGVIGVVVFNLETGEADMIAGSGDNLFYDQLCEAFAS